MSQSAQPDFANADVEQVLEEQAEQQAEEEQQQAEQSSLRRKIESRRKDKTVHLRVEGAKVPFEAPGGEFEEVEDISAQFAGVDEEDMTREEFGEYQKMRNRVTEILAEKSKDDAMTFDWWQSTFTSIERQKYAGKLMQGGEEGRKADGFRDK
jgi:hypothetical protein